MAEIQEIKTPLSLKKGKGKLTVTEIPKRETLPLPVRACLVGLKLNADLWFKSACGRKVLISVPSLLEHLEIMSNKEPARVLPQRAQFRMRFHNLSVLRQYCTTDNCFLALCMSCVQIEC
jgi:hypothetical protein